MSEPTFSALLKSHSATARGESGASEDNRLLESVSGSVEEAGAGSGSSNADEATQLSISFQRILDWASFVPSKETKVPAGRVMLPDGLPFTITGIATWAFSRTSCCGGDCLPFD